MTAAIENKVKKVVLLSTDKAVYPINAMGQSKALMEKVTIAKGRSLGPNDPIFSLTRYGNVMASRGSIIPLIISQIKSGKDLTITDPSMTRFLMSLEDSVSLVMHAFKYKEHLTVEELKTRLFKTSRPKSALMINEACEKGFFFLQKASEDQRKKFIKPSKSFIDEFNQYILTLKNLSF